MREIIKIDTIHQYNDYFGVDTLHPLVSVVDMSKCPPVYFNRINYGLYCLFLKDANCGPLRYGRSYYDYQKGTIVAVSPGQILGMESDTPIQPKGWALVFHPDLLYGTDLGRTLKNYTFFSYDANEALHLSEKEREIVEQCFCNIQVELERDVDKHTNIIISRSIAMLLDYCMRFYDRQFITRIKVNKDILTRFESVLDDYFQSNLPNSKGIPSVSYCADKVFLSPNYFGDLIKKETGKTAQEYIQFKIISIAKQRLAGTLVPINEISEELGFKYSTHFTRLFKKCVGISPSEYRINN